ncbi:hypothetical protein Nepgr_029427 [Nepenthes gracilis]|uniref:Uncharacterized protein n=1 Tax=Nepenthes gracilis TaxID=150966 RepID=A0AAD3Y521_NEPGR|nr:hypothetical protein Nepgr_029427 [Nepenthes gracilis]
MGGRDDGGGMRMVFLPESRRSAAAPATPALSISSDSWEKADLAALAVSLALHIKSEEEATCYGVGVAAGGGRCLESRPPMTENFS